MLELVEELHQEEGKLQFVSHLVKQVLKSCILDTDLHEVLSGDLRRIIQLVHVVCHCEHVLEVHLGDLKALFVCDFH